MTARTRDQLKTYFETGDKPSSAEMEDLIDSFVSATEDGTLVRDRGTFSTLDEANANIGGTVPALQAYIAVVGTNLYLARAGDSTYTPANSLTAEPTAYETAADLQADHTLTLGQRYLLADGSTVEKVIPQVRVEFTVVTTTANETFTLPMVDNGDENFEVSWGDGEQDQGFTTHDDARLTHTYATAGSYTLQLRGTCARIFFNNGGDKAKIVGAISKLDLDALDCGNAQGMFYGCENVTTVDLSRATTVTNGTSMFRSTGLTTVDLSPLAMLVTGSGMFRGCTSLATVSGLDELSNLTNASTMFKDTSALSSVASSFEELSSLENATAMFQGSGTFSVPLLGDVATLVTADGMFQDSGVTGTPEFYGMVALQSAQGMFRNCGVTGYMNLSGAVALTDASYMFQQSAGVTGVSADNRECSNWTEVVGQTSVTAAAYDAMLEDIDDNGPASGTFGDQGLAGDAHLDANRSVDGLAAVNSLLAKGWTRSGTF